MESERPDALFKDTYARRLAGAAGEKIVDSIPQGRKWAWLAPEQGTAFFAPAGWTEREYRPMLDEAVRLRRAPRMAWLWKALGRLGSKKRRAQFKRFSGFVLLYHQPIGDRS